MTGGSSSGCGAATAAGLAPVSLGSDTNGSIRVPAALCGVFSLKPTYGRIARGGAFPFVDSLDVLGPFARTAEDLALAYDAIQGPSERDHACRNLSARPTAPGGGAKGLRVGVLRGWFERNAGREALAARDRAAAALGAEATLIDLALDEAEAGRAAAYLVTNAESAAFHLPRLRERAGDFDPETRDRFLAGALLPAAWLLKAQKVRRWWLGRALAAFAKVDLLLAPATPVPAPEIGRKTLALGGREALLRPALGLLAQPFSAIGLPVATAPVFAPGAPPLGVQLVGRPWEEAACLRAAASLEAAGVAVAHPPRPAPAAELRAAAAGA